MTFHAWRNNSIDESRIADMVDQSIGKACYNTEGNVRVDQSFCLSPSSVQQAQMIIEPRNLEILETFIVCAINAS